MRPMNRPRPLSADPTRPDPGRPRRLRKQKTEAPGRLAVRDDALHALLTRAGRGGTY